MNIEPTYATFEQNKLLSDKGFKFDFGVDFKGIDDSLYCNYPEQHQVVEWLRVKHGIWIYILPYSTLFRPYAEEIIDKDRFGKWEGHKYSTPQEAYSKAFDYILNNLI